MSLVLEFEVEKGGTPPGTVGRAIHALFFEILRELNPDLAEKIHSMRPYKPFTLSPLLGEGEERPSFPLMEGRRVYLRITSIWEPLSEKLVGLERFPSSPLSLGSLSLRPLRLITDPSHELVFLSSYREIYSRCFLEMKEIPRKILLRFTSPTTFRVGRANLPFPLPHLVFRSYADRWNFFSNVHLGKFGDEAGRWIVVSGYRLKSRVVNLGRGKRVAFVGWCEFEVRKGAPEFVRRCMRLLSEYALFCGTGQGVTMGLGQTSPSFLSGESTSV